MVDGKLYLNRKQPKEVIMRKDQQEDMLTDIHVVKDNGKIKHNSLILIYVDT